MSDQPTDLTFLTRQQQLLVNEVRSMRDDMNVMMAIIQRLDGTIAGLTNEIRATHSQQSRFDRRLRDLEDATQT